jgi:hypothetical protein
MARNLAATAARATPPPFWQQLPKVFTYPAHGDAVVKIVAFAAAAALSSFLPLGWLWTALIWLAFLAYCFGILERTARGHLVPADVYMNDRVNRDYRPILQVVLFVIFMSLAGIVAGRFGPVAGQAMLLVVSLLLPASIMVLALDERLGSALNPLRLIATMAGIGLPYLALCVFLFLLLQSAKYLAGGLDVVLPGWASRIAADIVSMYFMVSMYYLMGYALYQNHEALGVEVQVDPEVARQNLNRSGAKAPPDILGPQTRGLVADGKLAEAAGRVQERLRREWDDNKLHDQYHKLLLLEGQPGPLVRHVNEYIPKLLREKKAARAVEVYEAARKVVPDLALTDGTLILPLATQAAELRRDAVALQLVKGFDKRYPDSGDIPGVYLLAGRILLERQNDYAMARKILLHLASKYPKHALAAEARRLAEIAGKMAAPLTAGGT